MYNNTYTYRKKAGDTARFPPLCYAQTRGETTRRPSLSFHCDNTSVTAVRKPGLPVPSSLSSMKGLRGTPGLRDGGWHQPTESQGAAASLAHRLAQASLARHLSIYLHYFWTPGEEKCNTPRTLRSFIETWASGWVFSISRMLGVQQGCSWHDHRAHIPHKTLIHLSSPHAR